MIQRATGNSMYNIAAVYINSICVAIHRMVQADELFTETHQVRTIEA